MVGIPKRSDHGFIYGSPIPPVISTTITIKKPGTCINFISISSVSAPEFCSFPFPLSFSFPLSLSFSFPFSFSFSLSLC
ncbi:hypothetical protein HanIR_Chr06g0286231 [Helianthus annuus]|nr:hypothetical protein HanIR_Chr06g0286231 [Helianthus annuus]